MNQNLSLRDVSTVLETSLNVVMATNKSVNQVASLRIFTALMRSALDWLDHIELTCHDVTVLAIPEFKSLEVPRKYYFL